MPKRSNDFQALVTFIYERISPEGGKVTESAMVFDKEAGAEREVDILLENTIAGHSIKIAIEVRGRGRKDSVEWIDNLIGKTKSLDIDKVVAVSSSGFTEAAKTKAKSNNIDLITLGEALEIDWNQYLIKPGIAVMTGEQYTLKNVMYLCEGEFKNISDLNLDATIVLDDEEVGTVRESFVSLFYDHFVPFFNTYIDEHRDEIFKTVDDYEKAMYLEKEIDMPNLTVVIEGDTYDFSKIKMIAHATRLVKKLEVEHAEFQNKLVSQATFQDENGKATQFKVLLDPDTEKAHVNWRKIETSDN